MEYKNLEQKRALWLGLYLLGMGLLAAGVLLMRGRRALGILMAGVGLVVWLAGSAWGKRRYQQACAQVRVRRGLGMADARFFAQKEAAALGFPTQKLVPAGQEADAPMLLHTAQGTLRGCEAAVTEMTQGYHAAGSSKRTYLIGTLMRVPAPAAREGLMLLCGHPYGGTLRAEDFAPRTLLDTQGHAFHALAAADNALTEAQSAALDAFCTDEKRNAVFLTENGYVTAFLPLRFYSGNYSFKAPLKAEALDANPLPELEDVLKVLEALAK